MLHILVIRANRLLLVERTNPSFSNSVDIATVTAIMGGMQLMFIRVKLICQLSMFLRSWRCFPS